MIFHVEIKNIEDLPIAIGIEACCPDHAIEEAATHIIQKILRLEISEKYQDAWFHEKGTFVIRTVTGFDYFTGEMRKDGDREVPVVSSNIKHAARYPSRDKAIDMMAAHDEAFTAGFHRYMVSTLKHAKETQTQAYDHSYKIRKPGGRWVKRDGMGNPIRRKPRKPRA